MARTPTEIKVYWDYQDVNNQGWAYEALDCLGLIDSGAIDVDGDDMDGAVDGACSQLCVDLSHDDFAAEQEYGGFAFWTD